MKSAACNTIPQTHTVVSGCISPCQVRIYPRFQIDRPARRMRCPSCASAIASPVDAFYRFNADDGWAIASHIALSALMSLFPFLILVTALGRLLFGSKELADEVGEHPAGSLADGGGGPDRRRNPQRADRRARRRAHHRRGAGDLFRLERHREPAHRAEPRLWRGRDRDAGGCCGWNRSAMCWSPRSALLALAFLVVLAPLIFATAVRYVPLARAAAGRCSTSCGSRSPRSC